MKARTNKTRRWAALFALPLLFGFLGTQCNLGGLRCQDFEQVNVNGFDAADNEVDANHYSYSMEYFQADGGDEGYLYVGTGNNIANLVEFYIQTLIQGGDDEDLLNAPIRPPEIRRYRPDLGPKEWERVFDYRDVEAEGEFRTIGFRFMTTLQIPDPAKQGATISYLYAATQGERSVLFRSSTGNPGEWEEAFAVDDLGASIRWIEQHNGRIYLAVAYDSFGATPPPGQLWFSDNGVNFEMLMDDGFGNPDNRGVQALISWNGWLYAGTKNDVTGFEIWKLDGPTKDGSMVQVVSGGGPSAHNENAGMPCIFKDHLYWGTQLYVGGMNFQSGNAFEGCDIIRLDQNDNWQTVVGPNSLSGYASGFNHFTNAYLWWMAEHDGWLYTGTYNMATSWAASLDDITTVVDGFDPSALSPPVRAILDVIDTFTNRDFIQMRLRAGADLYKSPDGVSWYPISLSGMGDPENYGWRVMESTPDGSFFLGSANPFAGTEVWRAGPTSVP